MKGIDLNQPMEYIGASYRYFSPGEFHVFRRCKNDVLLLVFEGVLHFTEDGKAYDVGAGEYFIQRKGCLQGAVRPSDRPKYFYVHFDGRWADEGELLPCRGVFSPEEILPLTERLDSAQSRNRTQAERTALFLQTVTLLYRREEPAGPAGEIGAYLRKHAFDPISLDDLSRRFSYSRNQIINLVKKQYGVTPLEYQHRYRLKRAEWLLRVTSEPLSLVAEECGYGEYSQFYKEFFRVYGVSPKRWRAEAQS